MFSRIVLSAAAALALTLSPAAGQEKAPLTVVVMDPLALQLSCPCVKGYAQRDYEALGKYLEKELGRPIAVHFSESLDAALKKKTAGKADLIIGKESIVRHESRALGFRLRPLLALSGKDGKTTMTGLIVVPALDAALTVSDLKTHRILFGPPDADEKHTAALDLLKVFEVAAPKKLELCNSCSEGATKILEMHREGVPAAAVISSYAQPLLEGCGTVKKGELRVVGETEPVPFIASFVSESVAARDRDTIEAALLRVGSQPSLCIALETKHGFVKVDPVKKK